MVILSMNISQICKSQTQKERPYIDLELYLNNDSDNGNLESSIPTGSELTASFPPRIGTLIIHLVGRWEAKPLKHPLQLWTLFVNVWARGDGIQRNTNFVIYPTINGQTISSAGSEYYIRTNSATLSSTPKEFTGGGDGPLGYELNAGDVFGIEIWVSERGSGGELVYGCTDYPSYTTILANHFETPFILTNISKPEISDNKAYITTSIDSVFGIEDINNYTLLINGGENYEDRNYIELNKIISTDEVIIVEYVWDIEKDKADVGEYLFWIEVNLGDNVLWSQYTNYNISNIQKKTDSNIDIIYISLLIGIIIIIAIVFFVRKLIRK